MLIGWVDRWPVLAPVVFVAVYAFAILFVPPSGTVMTAMAGFLFGSVLGSVVAVVGATMGATFVFLIARFLAGNIVRRKVTPSIRFMQAGFHHHAFSYMLMLRLLPLFPFWLVNLAPAFLHVPLRTFVFGTFLGIIPLTVVFAMFGAGLGTVLDRGQPVSLDGVLTPQILAGLLALAVLVLLPVFYRRRKTRV
ncbi:MAG: TVP38/TMEM64 family protein [Defluviicoccus sp.]|nr:MAG: TVP38/TMEM64 family protein [Defluviicoccus sp.]